MVRPQKKRIVKYKSNVCFFKPRGIPMLDLEEVCLTVDELEAIRLADLKGMPHEEGGQQMNVSRATFGRILQKARNKVAEALIKGKAIKVDGGNYKMVKGNLNFKCIECGHSWKEVRGEGKPINCPSCNNENINYKSSYN